VRSDYSRKVQGFINSLTDDDVVSRNRSRVGPMGRKREPGRERVSCLGWLWGLGFGSKVLGLEFWVLGLGFRERAATRDGRECDQRHARARGSMTLKTTEKRVCVRLVCACALTGRAGGR
jgi:hypothetical protein